MDAGIEKECSALGGLFQLIMNDMKVKTLIKMNFLHPQYVFKSRFIIAFEFYFEKLDLCAIHFQKFLLFFCLIAIISNLLLLFMMYFLAFSYKSHMCCQGSFSIGNKAELMKVSPFILNGDFPRIASLPPI